MPTSLALDPRYVLWSATEPQRAGHPLIVLMHGWSYDERHYADGWLMRPAVTFPLAGAAELVLQSA